MSIDVMREVWKHAPFKGGALLVLLAMADWADDDGGSIFPKVETLAKKARLSVRGAQLALRELEDAKVIEKVAAATGRPGRATEYRIVLERVKEVRPSETGAVHNGDGCSLQQEGVQSEAGRVQSSASHIDNHHSEPSLEPSCNPPAPSAPGGGPEDLFGESPPPPPPTKAQSLILAFEAYDQAAARLGWEECNTRSDYRRSKLGQRIDDAGGLDGWKAALEKVEASEFCMGRTPPRPGKPPFRMHIDFLLQQQSFSRLREGRYDNREGGSTGPAGGGSFLEAAGRVAARDTAGGP